MAFRRVLLLTIFAGGLAACSGDIMGNAPAGNETDPGNPNGGSGGEGGGGRAGSGSGGGGMAGTGVVGGTGGKSSTGLTAGPLPLRRLTRTELNNTLKDLLGDGSRPADDLPSDNVGESGFLAGNDVATVDADRIVSMAEKVATSATAKLSDLMGCDAAKTGESACVTQFLTTFGKRAYRRPLEAGEITALQGLFDKARTQIGLDFPNSVSVVLQVMLQSPSFLYHWEVAPGGAKRDGGLVKLGPYELASRLSYYLWQSMPDDMLMNAADTGKLASAADLEREARRLLADGRAKKTMLDFHQQWLKLTDVDDLVKGKDFTADMAKAAADEVAAFVDYTVFGAGGGKLSTLLSAPIGFANKDTAKLYGVSGVTGAAVQKVDLDPTQRAGLLTQVGFLALNAKGTNSEPIYRGVVVLERILCEQKPPPLPAVPMPKAPTADTSTRERHVEHQSNPVCVACHSSFEPLGYAFETYDGVGKWRTTDGGKPVDASGKVTTTIGNETFMFNNAVDLAKALVKSPQVQACALSKAYRFGAGRAETDADKNALAAALATYKKSDLDLRELLVAIVTSPSFLYRSPTSGEVLQ